MPEYLEILALVLVLLVIAYLYFKTPKRIGTDSNAPKCIENRSGGIG